MIKAIVWFVVLSLGCAAFYLVATNFSTILESFMALPLDYVGFFLLGAIFAFIAMWLTGRKGGGEE